MPKELERKLKARYGENSDIPYKIMNSRELMPHSKGKKKKSKKVKGVVAGY